MSIGEFSHRNGETEPPTIEGQYWLKGDIDGRDVKDMVDVEKGKDGIWTINWWVSVRELPVHLIKGQWWGPILPPWERNKNRSLRDVLRERMERCNQKMSERNIQKELQEEIENFKSEVQERKMTVLQMPFYFHLESYADSLDEILSILEKISQHIQEGDENATVAGRKGGYSYSLKRTE